MAKQLIQLIIAGGQVNLAHHPHLHQSADITIAGGGESIYSGSATGDQAEPGGGQGKRQ